MAAPSALKAFWSWVQNNSAGISILLSLAGFAILALQGRRTRRTAEAARKAAAEAREAILRAGTVAHLAEARREIGAIQDALRGSRWETAVIYSQFLRDRLSQTRGRTEFSAEGRQVEIQEMVSYLAKLQENLERKLVANSTRLDIAKACSRLSHHATIIIAWTEAIQTASRGVGDE